MLPFYSYSLPSNICKKYWIDWHVSQYGVTFLAPLTRSSNSNSHWTHHTLYPSKLKNIQWSYLTFTNTTLQCFPKWQTTLANSMLNRGKKFHNVLWLPLPLTLVLTPACLSHQVQEKFHTLSLKKNQTELAMPLVSLHSINSFLKSIIKIHQLSNIKLQVILNYIGPVDCCLPINHWALPQTSPPTLPS